MRRFLGRTKKTLAGLLAVLMVITSLPSGAYAYEASDNDSVIEETANTESIYNDAEVTTNNLPKDVTDNDITDNDVSAGDVSNGEDPVPPKPQRKVTVSLDISCNDSSYIDGKLKTVKVREFTIIAGEKSEIEDHVLNYDPNGMSVEITPDNYIEILGLGFNTNIGNDKDILFFRVTEGKNDPRYTTMYSGIELGSFNEDSSVLVEYMPIKTYGDTLSFVADAEPEKISFNISGEQISWYDGVFVAHKGASNVTMELFPVYGKTLKAYGLTGAISYSIGSSDPVSLNSAKILDGGDGISFSVPTEILAKGAFEGMTFTVGFEPQGVRDREIEIIQPLDYADTCISVDGKKLKTINDCGDVYLCNNSVVSVEPDKTAKVTVTPRDGYELVETYVIKQIDVDANCNEFRYSYGGYDDAKLLKWLGTEEAKDLVKVYRPNKDGIITCEIKADDFYYICNKIKPLRHLTVDDMTVGNSKKVAVAYNRSVYIEVRGDRSTYENVYDWDIKATIPGENGPSEITSGIDIPKSGNCRIEFNGNEYQGQEVTVTFTTKEKKAGTDEPVETLTVILSVETPITLQDISFEKDANVTLDVGTETEVKLVTGADFFTSGLRDRIGVKIDGEYGATDYLKASISFDPVDKTATVTVRSYVKNNNSVLKGSSSSTVSDLLESKDLVIKLIDKANDDNLISSAPLDLVDTKIKEANLSSITLTADSNSLTFDFSKVPEASKQGGFDKTTDGLYYLVDVSTGESEDNKSDQLINSFTAVVPASEKSFTKVLTNSLDSVENKAITYSARVRLILTDNSESVYSYTYAGISSSKDEVRRTATTVPNDLYAKSISFKENKKAKLVSSSAEVKLGSVSYSGDKKAVNKVAKIEVTTLNGEVLFTSAGDPEIIWEKNNDIFLNAYEAYEAGLSIGKFKINVYALQPKGAEVKATATLTLSQGIMSLRLKAPDVAYKKAGKDLKIKTEVMVYPSDKKNNKLSKSVKYCFVEPKQTQIISSYDAYDFEDNYEIVDYGKDITLKNGVITVSKKYAIQGDKQIIYVCAMPTDCENNVACNYDVAQIVITSEDLSIDSVYIKTKNGTINLREGESYYSSEVCGNIYAKSGVGQLGPDSISCKYTGLKEYKPDLENTPYRMSLSSMSDTMIYAPAIAKKASVKVSSKYGSGSKTINLSVKSDENLDFDLLDSEGKSFIKDTMVRRSDSGAYIIENSTVNEALTLIVQGAHESLIDHEVKAEGGKLTRKSSGLYQMFRSSSMPRSSSNSKTTSTFGTVYTVDLKDDVTLLKITDKTEKDENGKDKQILVYIINKTLLTDKSASKTTVTASNEYVSAYNTATGKVTKKDNKGNIFSRLYYKNPEDYNNYGSVNKVTYTVEIDGDVAAGQKVLISVGDSEVLSRLFTYINIGSGSGGLLPFDPVLPFNPGSGSGGLIPLNPGSGSGSAFVITNTAPQKRFLVTLDENGQFTIDYSNYEYGNGSILSAIIPFPLSSQKYFFDIPEGNYSFTVTPVTNDSSLSDAEAIAKTATVKFSAKPASEGKVKLSKTTFNKFVTTARFNFGTVNNVAVVTDDKGKVASVALMTAEWTTECRGMNVNGKINKFGEAFYVYGYSGVATLICCEDPATLDESYKKDHSKGMSGYVEYTWRSIDGSTKTGCEKITVKPVKGGDIIAIDDGE